MSKDLIALAGDLVAERKRLSESLRRLESTLTNREITQQIFRALGASKAEGVLAEIDGLTRSLDRLGALTKTLVQRVSQENLESCEPLLADAVLSIEAVAANLERPVVVDCRSNDVKVDREILGRFRPIFLEMLETMVEFCVESPKERLARKKRPKAYFQIDVKPLEGGYRVMVLCDGNGILPPMVNDHGLKLAEIGVRASFEGKPGQWSAWRYHLPTGIGPFHSVPVRSGGRRLCIPEWAVTAIAQLEEERIPKLAGVRLWSLDEQLCRVAIGGQQALDHGTWLVEISAGTHTATYVFDEVFEAEEGFMKPLSEVFSAQGRFLGVVQAESGEPAARDELRLVVNPSYMVYGEDTKEPKAAPKGVLAGAKGKHASQP